MTRVAAPMPTDLLRRVLQCYRDNSRYVLDAIVEHDAHKGPVHPDRPESWIAVTGNCSIPASCYIDDTGHFNAVELNITYNQLLYCGLCAAAADGLLPELRNWDVEAFFRHQLPDVLIVDYHAVFPRPLTPRAFRGRFEIREAIPKPHKDMLLLRTFCSVTCENDGHAEAEVLIALVHVGS
ncbi:MAG: FcoT family thioesterase [Planctomycetota bacterium]